MRGSNARGRRTDRRATERRETEGVGKALGPAALLADADVAAMTGTCECGHDAELHAGIEYDGACSADGCSCQAFVAADTEAAVDDEDGRGAVTVRLAADTAAFGDEPAGDTVRLALTDIEVEPLVAATEATDVGVTPPTPTGMHRWTAVLAPEGTATDDGRIFAPGSITWRDLPLSLMAMIETAEGHDGAQVAGRMERIWRDEAAGVIRAEGVFDAGEFGQEIARLVGEETLRGVSVDLAIAEMEIAYRSEVVDENGRWIRADRPADTEEGDEEPSMLDVLFGEDEEIIFVVLSAVIGTATVCPFPAFADASIAVAASLVATVQAPMVWTVTSQAGWTVTRMREPLVDPRVAGIVSRRQAVRAALTAAGVDETSEPVTTYELTQGTLAERKFMAEVIGRGLDHALGSAWPCEATLGDHGDALFRGENDAVFVLPDDTIAYVGIGHGWLHMKVASTSRDAATDVVTTFTAAYPPLYHEESDTNTVPITFWTHTAFGPSARLRMIESASWADIERNYTGPVRDELSRLAHEFEPGKNGQLLIWQGPPGTGKTWALRALASEWSSWAEFNYITDPDAFFNTHPSYMIDVLLHESYEQLTPDGDVVSSEDAGGKWRVLILEDTGELLSSNAKQESGQGLSRLLNVVDGMVGQGLRVLAIVTTNDEVESLHPAVTRPGRCASQIEFAPLTAAEASEWLGETTDTGGTLAELYAAAQDGRDALPADDPDEIAAVDDEPTAMTASAAGVAPAMPPASWFADPGLEELTPLTVDDDGRVFGHVAPWDECHIGIPGVCTTAPRSNADYAYFHLKEVVCDDGSRVSCGTITLDAPHADRTLSRAAATAHYDHTGTAAVDVVVGEDEHGIWLAGALRPDVDVDKARRLRGAALSGDWRDVNGNLELVGVLAVNVPGFPIPRTRALIASTETGPRVLALTAAGVHVDGKVTGIVARPLVTAAERAQLDMLRDIANGEYARLAAEAV